MVGLMPRRRTRGKTSAKTVETARKLRSEITPAERMLWEALRSRRLANLKFRRQHPYERFVLDFFYVKHQLVIEVDGKVHNDSTQAEHDEERTRFLEERGIRVVRFRNDEVMSNLDEVLKQIVEATKTLRPD